MLLPDADRDPNPVSHGLLQYKNHSGLSQTTQTIYVQALHSTLHFTVKVHLKQSKASQHAGPQQ